MSLYRYEPLLDSEIRLLTLRESSSEADDIAITLAHFDQSVAPEYECLSYVWGSEDDKKDIRVEGLISRSLLVTHNLDEAIRHLRYVDRPRIMWIDAVCIDQSNLDERSQQVSNMDQIFREASSVVFWLGTQKEQSSRGMQALDWLGSRIRMNDQDIPQALDPLDEERYGFSDLDRLPPFTDDEWPGVCDVLNRPWFNRLWIRQEIFLAGPSSIVQCGTATMSWPRFRTALQCLHAKARPAKFYAGFLNIESLVLQTFLPVFNLSGLREAFETTICKDPRDRIYAVRAFLTRDFPELEIISDYTLSAMKVYQKTVEEYLFLYNNLDFLRECRYNQDDPVTPTWVPDWSDNSLQGYAQIWRAVASSFLTIPTGKPVEDVLRIAGISAATIETLTPLPFQGDRYRWTASTLNKPRLRELILGPDQTSNTIIGDAELQAYVRTFVCDAIAENVQPSLDHYATLEGGKQCIMRALALDDTSGQLDTAFPTEEDNFDANFYINEAFICSVGRQFFRAQNGDFGLAPSVARPGDHVCVVVGCDYPMLLRPVTGGTFKVIGECFMLSIMHGQALLGKLPDLVRYSWIFNPRNKMLEYHFINDDSGETLLEDPRLERLGVDLTDYRQRLAQDPYARLEVEFDTLQRSNPAIRYFDLV